MKVKVIRSAVIDAPVERVWAVLRDFNSHRLWHEAVTGSDIENDLDGDVVGCVRRFDIAGAELREQLIRHSDPDRTYSYCILDATPPLIDYVATLRIKPVTDGNRTFLDWRSEFRTAADRSRELETFVERDIFEAGFTGLRKFLADQAGPSTPPVEKNGVEVTPVSVDEPLSSRAIVVETAGAPEVMTLDWATIPAPGPGQVRVRQTAVAVNYLDLMHRQGKASELSLPATPGLESVGEIIDVGDQVHDLFVGDRVACLTRTSGAYAESRCVDAGDCLPLPAGITDLEASTLLKGATAGLLLGRIFNVAPGKVILIQSIAGGLGHLLCQWAKSLNLKVMGTVSTVEKARFIRDLGCDFPIVLEEGIRLRDEVMRMTNGKGVDYGVHSNDGADDAFSCLARCGHMALIGDRGGQPVSIDTNTLKKQSLSVSVPVCFDYFDDRIYLQRLAHQYFTKIQSRSIIPAIETFHLSHAADAHKQIESRQNMGAIVLVNERSE